MTTQTIKFSGTVGGVTYADPTAFEKAARNLGYRRHGERPRASAVKLGTEVCVTVDGEKVRGQVWSHSPRPGHVWLALTGGRYGLWRVGESFVDLTDGQGRVTGRGQVAA